MTEADWLSCADSQKMLECLRDKASDRKLRLFAVARFRRKWHLLPNEQCQRAVEVSERFADGKATGEELEAARERVLDWHEWIKGEDFRAIASARDVTDAVRRTLPLLLWGPSTTIRDIFGNPFRPVTLDPAWLSPTVLSLAQAIYDERAVDRLPILADALEDAGCTHEEILNHCRQPREHARSCWCVDLVLGKQ